MINAEDEDSLRLGMFAVSLLVIASRQRTYLEAPPDLPRESYPTAANDQRLIIDVRQNVLLEARAMVEAVVEEAKRLNAQRKTV